MSSRWEHPNFNPWEWDEAGENDLTRELRKMIHNQVPVDREVLLVALMDLLICHVRITGFKEDTFKARTLRLFRKKGDK